VFLSIPRAAARQESQGTRDTTPVCAKVGTARPRCTRYWRRTPCLLTSKRTGTIDPGSKECASHTFGGDPLTGIRRRCGGQAVAALCRCSSRLHRSGRAQGPAHASKVRPSMCSSLRSVTSRSTPVDKAPCGATASSLSASCQ
jgi:hypothetical protein